MQTKKRAKSVSFGKPKAKVEEPKEEPKIEAEPKEEEVEKAKAEAQETKEEERESEEDKIAVKEEEPAEIHLSDTPEAPNENIPEKKEEEEVIEEKLNENVPHVEPPFKDFSKIAEKEENKKNNIWFFIWVVVITFIIALVCITGVYYFTTNKAIKPPSINLNFKLSSPTATPIPTVIPTATPKPVDLSAYSITVLNGSGTTGEAVRLKQKLVTAGFKVGTTGNADNSNYANTVIEAKKATNQEYLSALVAELKKTYLIDANIATLKDSDTSDVVVVIGASTAK